MTAEEQKDEATALLVNYLEAIGKKAGFRWDSDYTAEVSQAVHCIVQAAVLTIDARVDARLDALEKRLDGHGQRVGRFRQQVIDQNDRVQHKVGELELALKQLAPIDPRD